MKRLVLALCVTTGGCALLEPATAPAPATATAQPAAAPRPARSSALEIMAYLARTRPMAEAALLAEATRQRQAIARDGDVARVKAALALTLAHHADDAEVVALVEPVMKRDQADPDWKAMAGFLHMMAADRRRLRESAAAANARVRDERRAQDAMRQKAEAAQERAAQLQQKLDALTEIERSLSDRQVPNR